jgi:hypothetical protein
MAWMINTAAADLGLLGLLQLVQGHIFLFQDYVCVSGSFVIQFARWCLNLLGNVDCWHSLLYSLKFRLCSTPG